MEQGSERNITFGDKKEDEIKDTPGFERKRSILKTSKNVWFNLDKNKVKII